MLSKEVKAGINYRADWALFRYTTTWRARWARSAFSVHLWRTTKPDRDRSCGVQVEVHLPVARTVQSVALFDGGAGGSQPRTTAAQVSTAEVGRQVTRVT